MVDDEIKGIRKPVSIIIKGTSVNTGMGLALVAAVRGYRCIFTTTDKQSKAKIDLLRAMGAEVIVCPTNVEPDDPESYYSEARCLGTGTRNFYIRIHYITLNKPKAHNEPSGLE